MPGSRVEFVKGPRGDSPEDQLLVQFQGMFAEYEKAQLMERYRRGKAYRARTGSVNVLSGAPFGYRYVRKTPRVRRPLRDRRARGRAGRGDVPPLRRRRRLHRGPGPLADRARACPPGPARTAGTASVIWGMLRNPAYAGTAVFGKTQAVHEPPGLNRRARLAGPHRAAAGPRPWTGPGRSGSRSPSPPSSTTGDVRPGAAAAGRQQAVRRPQHQGPVPAAGPGRLRGLRLRLLPHLDHAPPARRSTTTGASAPMTTGTRAAGSAATSRSAPTTSTRSSGTTSPPCSPTRP